MLREWRGRWPAWFLFGYNCTLFFAAIMLYRLSPSQHSPLLISFAKKALQRADLEHAWPVRKNLFGNFHIKLFIVDALGGGSASWPGSLSEWALHERLLIMWFVTRFLVSSCYKFGTEKLSSIAHLCLLPSISFYPCIQFSRFIVWGDCVWHLADPHTGWYELEVRF